MYNEISFLFLFESTLKFYFWSFSCFLPFSLFQLEICYKSWRLSRLFIYKENFTRKKINTLNFFYLTVQNVILIKSLFRLIPYSLFQLEVIVTIVGHFPRLINTKKCFKILNNELFLYMKAVQYFILIFSLFSSQIITQQLPDMWTFNLYMDNCYCMFSGLEQYFNFHLKSIDFWFGIYYPWECLQVYFSIARYRYICNGHPYVTRPWTQIFFYQFWQFSLLKFLNWHLLCSTQNRGSDFWHVR